MNCLAKGACSGAVVILSCKPLAWEYEALCAAWHPLLGKLGGPEQSLSLEKHLQRGPQHRLLSIFTDSVPY